MSREARGRVTSRPRAFLYIMRRLILAIIASWLLPASAQPVPPEYQKAGMAAYHSKEYGRCAKIFVAAERAESKRAIIPVIGAARCFAGGGNASQSLRYLRFALSRGYRNCRLLASDAIWAPLRAGDQWSRVMRECLANEERYYGGLNAEVFVAFLNDQLDRGSGSEEVSKVLKKDADRRRIVHLSIGGHFLRTPDDYYHAAMVMQHGTTPEDLALARDLAKRATDIDPAHSNARWLYAAATDRYLQRTGKPQIYGTQYRSVDGRWTLDPFDQKAIDDEERARWAVPSLAERLRFIEELNAQQPEGQ